MERKLIDPFLVSFSPRKWKQEQPALCSKPVLIEYWSKKN
jgi:hypothetical protein